jgi:hypothetical protein
MTCATASLQIPYLLTIAHEFNTWVQAFPPARNPTLSLLRKLDHCFASLLSGEDVITHETLPGFENGIRRGGLSGTDMVRCRSIVEATRLIVVEVMTQGGGMRVQEVEDDEGDTDMEGIETPGGRRFEDDEDEGMQLDVARVYEHTLVELGKVLGEGDGGGPPAEVKMSDDWGEIEGSSTRDS